MGNRKLSGFVSVALAQFVAMTMLVIGARAASTTTVFMPSAKAPTEQNLTKALRSTLRAIFMARRWPGGSDHL